MKYQAKVTGIYKSKPNECPEPCVLELLIKSTEPHTVRLPVSKDFAKSCKVGHLMEVEAHNVNEEEYKGFTDHTPEGFAEYTKKLEDQKKTNRENLKTN
jgi:hypothetical protein